MKSFLLIFKRYPLLILIILEALLFVTNFKSGTYLIGWDNLYPEFNFGLNIKRSIFAIWQEYRGLGLLDGMSHAANLPHYIFLWLLSWILPQNMLRYFFIFLMHFLGGVGIYLLISNFQFPRKNSDEFSEQAISNKKIIALIGALFYQYNLATIQMFYLPFELFLVHFAALPWTVYALQNYLVNPVRKAFIFLVLVLFLSIPQAHVPSIFLVYAFAYGVILLFTFIQNRKRSLRIILSSLVFLVIVNSFWGIPYFYSTLKNASTIAHSKNNQMATDDIYLRNKAYGDLGDVVTLRGLSLDFVQYDYVHQVTSYMFEPWKKQSDQIGVQVVGWIFFLFSLFGIVATIKKREARLYPFVFLWATTFLLLGNDIPILGLFSDFLNNFIPYFHNVFRFVFTKFSILYVFSYSILLSYGLYRYVMWVNVRLRGNYERILYSGVILLIGYSALPVFGGNFFYSNLRVNIPQDYFKTFSFFQKQDPTERIAVLPLPWYWAWTQNSWNTIGSGFIWFGLPQPLLDRAFDPWSKYNENYYWEIAQALYSGNGQLFEKLLDKYQVAWLLYDTSIINPSSPKVLNTEGINTILLHSNKIVPVATYGKIHIYKVNLLNAPNSLVMLKKDLPVIGPKYGWNNNDRGYQEYGMYISEMNNAKIKMQNDNSKLKIMHDASPDVYYPFRSLFTGRQQGELEFGLKDNGDYFSFSAKIPKSLEGQTLLIPPIASDEVQEVDPNNLDNVTEKYPEVWLDGKLVAGLSTPASPAGRSGEPLRVTPGVSLGVVSSYADRPGGVLGSSAGGEVENNQQKTTLEGGSLTVRHSEEAAPSFSNNNRVSYENYSVNNQKAASFEADLVHLANSLNDWTLNLETSISRLFQFVKIQLALGVDPPGVAPGRLGLRAQSSELAEPAPYIAYQESEGLVKGVYAAEIETASQDSIHPGGVIASQAQLATPGVGTSAGGEVTLRGLKDDSLLEIRVPKIYGYYSAQFPASSAGGSDFSIQQPKSCDQFNKGVYEIEKIKDKSEDLLRLTSVGSSNCLDFDLPNLAQRYSYLVSVDSRNVEGKSLLFAVINKNSQRADIETYLPRQNSYPRLDRGSDPRLREDDNKLVTSYFILPPMEQFGVGYTLHLDNISIGRDKTINDLGKISVQPLPYQFLTSIKILKSSQILWGTADDKVTKLNVEHPNPSYYEVTFRGGDSSTSGESFGHPRGVLGQQTNETLMLSQSYDEGWHAYEMTSDWLTDSWYMKLLIPLFGKEIEDHVEVNNWENGWNLSRSNLPAGEAGIKDQRSKIKEKSKLTTYNSQPTTTIAIVYLPQYLEYLGFGMLGGLVVGLLLSINRKGRKPGVGFQPVDSFPETSNL